MRERAAQGHPLHADRQADCSMAEVAQRLPIGQSHLCRMAYLVWIQQEGQITNIAKVSAPRMQRGVGAHALIALYRTVFHL